MTISYVNSHKTRISQPTTIFQAASVASSGSRTSTRRKPQIVQIIVKLAQNTAALRLVAVRLGLLPYRSSQFSSASCRIACACSYTKVPTLKGCWNISKAFLLQESSLSKTGSGPSLPTRAVRHRGGADSLHVNVATLVYHAQLLVRTVGPFPLLRSSRQELTV